MFCLWKILWNTSGVAAGREPRGYLPVNTGDIVQIVYVSCNQIFTGWSGVFVQAGEGPCGEIR